jgi:hypothetical protein
MFGESQAVLEACLAIEAAFSRHYFEGISEQVFQQELENAVRTYRGPVYAPAVFPYGEPQSKTKSATRSSRLVLEVP